MPTKVLLIEDNDDTALLIQQLLHRLGYLHQDIIRCSDLASVANVTEDYIQLIIADLTLPDSSYNQTFSHLQRRFPYIPIIVCSANSEMNIIHNVLLEGAQDYITKIELNETVLKKSIQYAIDRKQRENVIEKQNEELRRIAWLQSHEVRKPVANMLGLIELLNYNNPAAPENKLLLTKLKEQALETDKIIREITIASIAVVVK